MPDVLLANMAGVERGIQDILKHLNKNDNFMQGYGNRKG